MNNLTAEHYTSVTIIIIASIVCLTIIVKIASDHIARIAQNEHQRQGTITTVVIISLTVIVSIVIILIAYAGKISQ